jgi:ferredoxin-NADP reductase
MGREETIQLHVDGPYGSPGLDLESYPVIVLVAGGIGITPVASILGHLLRLAQEASLGITTQKHCLKHVYLVWTVRQATSLTWFTRLIQECLDYNDTYLPTRGPRDVEFHILLHVTRKNRRKTETQTRELTSDSHNRSSDMSASLLQHDELKQTSSSSTFHQSQSSTRFFQDETTSALDFLPDHKFGRPDMASVFNQVVDVAAELAAQKAVHMSPSRRSQAPSMESVLVFSCGPEAMLDAIDDEIGTAWNPLIPFTHHKETFKF